MRWANTACRNRSSTLYNTAGRLTEAATTSGSTVQAASVFSYDKAGRPTDHWQCTPFNCGSSSIGHSTYGYDLAGDPTNLGHPGNLGCP